MQEVLRALRKACAAGSGGAELVTVIRASGSSPRGEGACMAVGSAGRLAGTIGGGALEYVAEGQALAHLLEKRTQTAGYDLSSADAPLGMVCGGTDELLYTYLSPEEKTLQVLSLAGAALQTGTEGKLILPLAGGIGFLSAQHRLFGIDGEPERFIRAEGRMEEAPFFVLPLKRHMHVLILGGGHIAQALSHLLPWLGFTYEVVEDRPRYADAALFPGASAVTQCPYNDLSGLPAGQDCIVIVTEGHRGDYEAEKWALTTRASYIGVIGSKTKTAFVDDLLKKDGYDETQRSRITAPIGVPIGSRTPQEIAVSIAAQLISHRAQQRHRMDTV